MACGLSFADLFTLHRTSQAPEQRSKSTLQSQTLIKILLRILSSSQLYRVQQGQRNNQVIGQNRSSFPSSDEQVQALEALVAKLKEARSALTKLVHAMHKAKRQDPSLIYEPRLAFFKARGVNFLKLISLYAPGRDLQDFLLSWDAKAGFVRPERNVR